MTDTDLWAVAREYDEQWPADTSNDAARMARLALRTLTAFEFETRTTAAARAEVADRDRRLADVKAVLADAECAECHPTADREDTPCGPMCALRQKVRAALGDADTLAEEGCRPGCKPGGACKWIGCENHDERVRAQEREAVLDEARNAISAEIDEMPWHQRGDDPTARMIDAEVWQLREDLGAALVRALRTQGGER